jgi:pimeloyl-ACP methyl ester carboxylesterase
MREFNAGKPCYQMHVEVLHPAAGAAAKARPPMVFLHGGAHTGACYLRTPDGRPGWAPYAVERGWTAIVPDWPGHGRSAQPPDFARMSGMRVVEATQALLEAVDPAVLVTHSMSGAFGWKLAELMPDRVLAVVGIAPSPPGNIQPSWSWPAYPEDQPIQPSREEVRHFTTSPRFPAEAFDAYFASIVPESARIYNERLNVLGAQIRLDDAESVRSIPMLIVSADIDPNHPGSTDATTATFVGADHLMLAERGLDGHGHLMMIEHGNLEIAARIFDWLAARLA